MHRGISWDKVENSDLQSTPQVLPSFEEYTPPVTCPEQVEETLGTSVEVEPLDEIQLEDLGLNTYNHDIPLSNRELPRGERGLEPPIKPHSSDSFRMKEVDSLTINTTPSPHVASFPLKDTYCYYRPCIDDPKKHYGFKLGKGLSLFDRPNKVERGRTLEAHRLEPILQQQISQCIAPSHHDDPRDDVTSYTRRRHNSSSNEVTSFMTTSARTDSNAYLEDSSYDGVNILFAKIKESIKFGIYQVIFEWLGFENLDLEAWSLNSRNSASVQFCSPAELALPSVSDYTCQAFMVEISNVGHFARSGRLGQEVRDRSVVKNQTTPGSKRTSSGKMALMHFLGIREFEKVKQEKDGIDFKIEKFEKASKDLDQLLGSQITNKCKKGLGYHAVPPPHPLIYNAPTKLDLSYYGLEEFQQPVIGERRRDRIGKICSEVKPLLEDKKGNKSKKDLVIKQLLKQHLHSLNDIGRSLRISQPVSPPRDHLGALHRFQDPREVKLSRLEAYSVHVSVRGRVKGSSLLRISLNLMIYLLSIKYKKNLPSTLRILLDHDQAFPTYSSSKQ
ncbi:hypothetical protein Tco_0894479 [Tanacetum coccineum]|uniref:Uncharacterized protein n=1 Tax=Tanacetum coccineum TaxID=301880 RepID=A0ABQ5CEP2_9ASTR